MSALLRGGTDIPGHLGDVHGPPGHRLMDPFQCRLSAHQIILYIAVLNRVGWATSAYDSD
jgi:hypothetical protein